MSPYLLSDHAEVDFLEVYDYLDSRSRTAALRWERNMLEAFDHLARYPMTGAARPDLRGDALRIWPVDEYVVIYAPETEPVRIMAVLHGSRDIPTVLQQRAGNQAKPV